MDRSEFVQINQQQHHMTASVLQNFCNLLVHVSSVLHICRI
uniref:Uncharacterized protein n=1 Tax=Arundo donax TaxID=35708 RepID=A0A0A9D306_ARUDO